MRPAFGDWRSLVAHFVRDEGVGGSNPLSPTKFEKPAQRAGFFASAAHEDENLRGQGGSTRAKRENVAPATARRASHEVASNPLSPTKFEKPAQRAGFFAFVAHEDENLRGRGGSTRRRYCYGLQVFPGPVSRIAGMPDTAPSGAVFFIPSAIFTPLPDYAVTHRTARLTSALHTPPVPACASSRRESPFLSCH